MKLSMVAAGCVVALGGFVTGCQPTVDRVDPANPQAVPNPIVEEKVFSARGLRRHVWVSDVRYDVVNDDMLRVEADVENITRRARTFRYLFEWFDENGMQIGQSTWRTQRLQGGQMGTITAVANSPDAVDFRVQLQRAR